MNTIVDSFDDAFADKDRVLVVSAHPDDNEIICGALVARLIAAGKRVRLVVTTNGNKGTGDKKVASDEFGGIRTKEQIAAAKELGIPATECFNLNIPDGELETSVENIKKVVFHIRQFKPDIVITHNPDEVINTFSSKENVHWVNHRDHRHTAIITTDAVYPYSRDRAFFPDQLNDGLEPHTVYELMFSDSYEHPLNRFFDVTDYVDKKRRALRACPSVVEAEHVEEYIDEIKLGDRYYEQLRYLRGLY
ncbi:MAG TPA: PIG-L deacetylase family protein [Candidatus Saccharimonadales bacterium]|nr:PIG-L deacetylase family protein [Candidatus Saccharimonadales bacterium]